jgi:hypothetical protein
MLKKLYFLLLMVFSSSNGHANGGYSCSYELREFYGIGYVALKEVSSLYPFCGELRAKEDALSRCKANIYPNSNRQCVFLGCEEDRFLDCSGQR